jgi:uncharacterized protein (DUF1330 family)
VAKGYLIFEIVITDPKVYDEYRALAGPVLARFGGRFLVRDGRFEELEGGWTPKRFCVVEFDSYDAARKFYFSDEYQKALKLRLESSTAKSFLVEGT